MRNECTIYGGVRMGILEERKVGLPQRLAEGRVVGGDTKPAVPPRPPSRLSPACRGPVEVGISP